MIYLFHIRKGDSKFLIETFNDSKGLLKKELEKKFLKTLEKKTFFL